MPSAQINGIDIHYRERGEGYPVFLLHGFTGNLRNWALQIPPLSEEFRTLSLDHRGHGQSEKPTRPDGYTLEQMAEDAQGLLAHLGIRECFLAGHSMGGIVAQLLALSHPDAVRALVLVDTAAQAPDGMRSPERARLAETARERGMEAVFEEQLRSSPLRERLEADARFLETYRQQFLLTSPDAYIYLLRAMTEGEPLLDRLNAITTPTLVVCGEDDEPFLGPSRRIHERIPGSELTIIPGAGHTPQIEKPAEFNRVLMRFLLRVRQGAAAGG